MQFYQAMAPRDKGGDGVKIGTSVGAVVGAHKKNDEGGMDIEHVELLEASMVGIPMNQRSWVQKAAKAIAELDAAQVETDDDDTPDAPAPVEQPGDVEDAPVEAPAPEATSSTTQADIDATNAEIASGEVDKALADDITTKGDLSTADRSDLPDSAFACPEKRK